MTGTRRRFRARPSRSKGSTGTRQDLAGRLRARQGDLRRQLARAEILAEMIRAVNSSLEPDRVADAMVARVAEWIPVPAWLVVAAVEGAESRTIAVRGLAPPLDAAALAVADRIVRSGAVLSTADVTSDSRLEAGNGWAPAAAVGFPLECRGRIVGAVVGLDRGPSSRDPALAAPTLKLLQAALEPGAIALDNALRVQRAEALSVTDDLTQLYNSRYLSQVLRRETKRTSRSGRPLSLLFLDLDGFKNINDTHGHLFGSAALVEAAGVIRTSARETDVVARFGGDEFALVLPETGSEGAVSVAERIRDRIEQHAFLRVRGLAIRLTVSIGVATLPEVANSAEQLIQAADVAMYWVKDHGKNGVHVAGKD